MYPNLHYAFQDLFGVDWKFLTYINSFGFFVALSFIAAAIVLSKELKRKERQGLLHGEEETIIVGKPATVSELFVNFLLGFLFGYKIIGLFVSNSESLSPQEFIFSSKGNMAVGLILGFVFAGLKYYEKNKQKLPQPEERKIRIWPHDRVGDITIYAAIFGFLGAKIFDILEAPSDFIESIRELRNGRQDIGKLIFSGLTFYGGLICAALAIWIYARKHRIGFWFLNDAAAPSLMLAYGLGRIGCQVAGDGDWGINNTTPKPISWLPDWIWSYTYPHNVIDKGEHMIGCSGQYCSELAIPVFPTPFYETIVCLFLFALLWSVRKRFTIPGTFFSFYLILNGIERFFIEKIRVNATYSIFGFHPTQAELISTALVLTGAVSWFLLKKNAQKPGNPPAPIS